MEHPSVDFPVELKTFSFTVEDGIIRCLITARLIVAMVNIQTAFQPLQGAIDGDDMIVVSCIESQRVDLFHIDGEVFVVELAVLGKELEHSRHDATRELEILVFRESDTSKVGHDDHTFTVAQ